MENEEESLARARAEREALRARVAALEAGLRRLSRRCRAQAVESRRVAKRMSRSRESELTLLWRRIGQANTLDWLADRLEALGADER